MTQTHAKTADTKERVWRAIDDRRPEAVELLRDLVRIPSFNPPGDEKEVADFCARFMKGLGMEVEQIEPFPKRVSNVGRLRGTGGRPVLLFNSHLDTFPPGDASTWRFPPLEARVHDGKVWGPGSKNMKMGIASVLFALRVLKDLGVRLRGDVLVSQTADEILMGYKGLGEVVRRGMLKADYGVYTESDPPIKIEIAHRGLVWVAVKIRGRTAHTSVKWNGLNPIVKAADVVKALETMEFTRWEPHPYIQGPPIISVNRIEAGVHGSMVPELCTIQCDVRTLPPQTTRTVVEDIRKLLDAFKARDPEFDAEVEVRLEAESSSISADEPIVKALQQAIREAAGVEMGVGGVGSTSDARWLRLKAGIPTAKFTFASTASGEANEFQDIEDYVKTIKVYAALMLNLLG